VAGRRASPERRGSELGKREFCRWRCIAVVVGRCADKEAGIASAANNVIATINVIKSHS
jgi:hypothetical protein